NYIAHSFNCGDKMGIASQPFQRFTIIALALFQPYAINRYRNCFAFRWNIFPITPPFRAGVYVTHQSTNQPINQSTNQLFNFSSSELRIMPQASYAGSAATHVWSTPQ